MTFKLPHFFYLVGLFLFICISTACSSKKQEIGITSISPIIENLDHLSEEESEFFLKESSSPFANDFFALDSLIEKAKNGDLRSQKKLANTYYYGGKGIAINLRESFKWYARAANQNDAEAQHQLGMMYLNAKGTRQDFNLAYVWLRKSAKKGHAKAQNALAYIYETGMVAHKSMQNALKWYQKSAQQGYSHAQFNLGILYWQGKGIEKNLLKAYKWLSRAAEQDNFQAEQFLKKIKREMSKEQLKKIHGPVRY